MFRWVGWLLYAFGSLVLGLWWLITKISPAAGRLIGGHKKAEGSLGSSEFADDRKLEKAGAFKPGGFLAVASKSSKKRIYCHHEASLITVGQKGLGKTQSYIALIKALKEYPKSKVEVNGPKGSTFVEKQVFPDLIIYEPKGTVMGKTEADLKALDYKIMELDIRAPDKSAFLYDPLSILNPTDALGYDEQVRKLAMLISPPAVHGKHDHFDAYPRIMIAGVIKHELTRGATSLPQCVRRLIVSKRDREQLFKEMRGSRDDLITGAVEAFDSAGDREKGSFITTNFEKMNFWLDPGNKWMFEGTGKWSPEDEKKLGWTWDKVMDDEKPIAVFIKGGLSGGQGNLVRLIVGNAVNSALRRFQKTGKPLRKPMWLLVDEAKTLGNCDAILNINRELREARVNLAMWWLSLGDIKKTYEDWSTLLSGSDVIGYGNSLDNDWYQFLERGLGKYTAKTESQSESDHSKGKGTHEAQRNLKNMDELAELPFEECVALMRSKLGLLKIHGLKPFYIKNDEVRFY